LQGAEDAVVDALSRGDVATAPISRAERALLEYVVKLTRNSSSITAADSQQLRAHGWADEQIAEAVYIAALFAFLNRVADAFGLQDPKHREALAAGKTPPPPAVRGK
jgi:uncharacterized peroxidase-related enzyme